MVRCRDFDELTVVLSCTKILPLKAFLFSSLICFSVIAFPQSGDPQEAFLSDKQTHHFMLKQFEESLSYYDSLCLISKNVPLTNHQTAFLACDEILKTDGKPEIVEKRNYLVSLIYNPENRPPDPPNNQFKREYFHEDVIKDVDTPPEFPGGVTAFYRNIGENLTYPPLAASKKVRGTVYVEFIVDSDGIVRNVKPIKGIGAGCDEEAVRVVSNLPAFTPAYKESEPVAVRMVLPIIFRIN